MLILTSRGAEYSAGGGGGGGASGPQEQAGAARVESPPSSGSPRGSDEDVRGRAREDLYQWMAKQDPIKVVRLPRLALFMFSR